MQGNSFIHCIQLRINQLPTREQSTREGRPGERKCRGSGKYVETISHILHRCPCTHGPRIQRHDSIARLFADTCIAKGWQVTWAPRICTPSGLKKPDLITVNPVKIAVVDVTVVWDTPEQLDRAYQDKVDLYNQPSIRHQIITTYGDKEIQFGAIIISPHGAWCHRDEAMLGYLELTKATRNILIVRCMEKSYKMYRTFMKIT